MPNPYALLPNATSQPQQKLVWGQVSTSQPAPATFTSPLYVVRPAWSPNYYWAITDWPACHGATLPAQGAECLLAIDTANNLRCVWWDGIYTAPTVTGAQWITPTLLNSWANYGAPDPTAAYLKDPTGFVHLRGVLASGASGSEAFALPAGFRPAATYSNTSVAAGDGTAPVAAFLALSGSTGSVTPYVATTFTFVDLTGVSFLAEN